MRSVRVGLLGAVVAAAAVAVAASIGSCAQTPPNITLHTFKQAQKVDVVCIQVNDANGNPLPVPVPTVEDQCVPVPANVNGAAFANHLYAVVTQTTAGALAVVDLTAGVVVDVDRSTPGVDFIPVGANPTDVAVTRDGRLTLVSSADPNKTAIYAIDNTRLIGDSLGNSQPLRLTDLRACALPQPPQALAVVPMGAPDAGSTGAYAIVALLRAQGGKPAAVITIDPTVLSPPPDAGPGTAVAPGSLSPCQDLGAVMGVTALSGDVPPSWMPGPAWPDGVPYADAGVLTPVPQCPSPPGAGVQVADAAVGADDAGDAGEAGVTPADAASMGIAGLPPHPTSMALRTDLPVLYVADDAVPVIHVIDLHDPTSPRELDPLLATSVAEPTRRVAVGAIAISPSTRDYKTYLYAIDARQGTLMVYDITDPSTSPHTPLERPHPELNPLASLDRITFSAPVAAVSFAQHDWPVPSPNETPPVHQYTGLLCNPNPNAHPDAGAFIDLGAYYRADQAALIQPMVTHGGTVQTFPIRLRGVFGFATLSNGTVVTIDVDDWDAPCRRPDPMAVGPVTDCQGVPYPDAGITGVLDVPQPGASAPDDLDPYHAPLTYCSAIPESPAVTLEAFFPVSAPHRLRSSSLLRTDPSVGVHVPNVSAVPQLFNATGAPVVTGGAAGATSPLLLPTPLPPGFIDPTYIQNPTEPNPAARTPSSPLATATDAGILSPVGMNRVAPGVRVSFDDPTAHQDQDWTVTYEGALPTVSGIAAGIASTDEYRTLTLSAPGAQFCSRGIEDLSIGQARVAQLLATLGAAGLAQMDANGQPRLPALPAGVTGDAGSAQASAPADPSQWTADYVEITDDLLPSSDPYWNEPQSVNDCWDGDLANDQDPSVANKRYTACQQRFGSATDADTHLWRDLPIIHARDESLQVGRFGWEDSNGAIPEQTTNRVIVPSEPAPDKRQFLRITRCCFHHQASFKVRAGGEWVTVGSAVQLLHRIQADSSPQHACVLSCEPRNALMNARAFDIPWWQPGSCMPQPQLPTFDRDSPLAMRNPMFSFFLWSGCGSTTGPGDHTLATRDLAWRFSMRGGFSPLSLQLTTQTTGNAVSPQSMRFINSLGQLAVVDGEAQGLVLIDLNVVAAVRNFF
jgi:hypothetical protein